MTGLRHSADQPGGRVKELATKAFFALDHIVVSRAGKEQVFV